MHKNQNQNQNKNRQRGRNSNNRRGGSSRGNNFESNGPEVKVRGSAQQVLDKYLQLARDAQSSGDRVNAEGYLQYAEHYYRIINADSSATPQTPQAAKSPSEVSDGGVTDSPSSEDDGAQKAEKPRPRQQRAKTSRANVRARTTSKQADSKSDKEAVKESAPA